MDADAGDAGPEDAAQDARADGDVIAPDGGCWAVAPNVTCDYTAASETESTTPGGLAVLRLESTEARAQLCAGSWLIERCGYTESYTSDAGAVTQSDAGCDELAHPGGLVRIQCGSRTTYTVAGDVRWERVTSWDSVQILAQ